MKRPLSIACSTILVAVFFLSGVEASSSTTSSAAPLAYPNLRGANPGGMSTRDILIQSSIQNIELLGIGVYLTLSDEGKAIAAPFTDIDGDGLRDAIAIRAAADYFAVQGINGTDGEVLWSRHETHGAFALEIGGRNELISTPNVYSEKWGAVAVSQAKVGEDGEQGLIVLTYSWIYSSYQYVRQLRIQAVDSTGRTLWDRKFDAVYSVALGVVANWASVTGFLNATPGDATDVLLDIFSAGVAEVAVVDGRDGSVALRSLSAFSEGLPRPGPDLSGDGLDDYIITDPYTHYTFDGYLLAFKGTDSSPLWQNWEAPWLMCWCVIDAGDLDGDGIDDLVLKERGWVDFRGVVTEGTINFLSGRDGGITWRQSTLGIAVTDAGSDGSPDVLSTKMSFDDATLTVTLRAYDVEGGEVFSVAHSVARIKDPWYTFVPRYRATSVGDVNNDHVVDVGITFIEANRWYYADVRTTRQVIVSGFDGREIWSGSWTTPLLASLDGDGEDLLAGNGSGFTAKNGHDGSQLYTIFHEGVTSDSSAAAGDLDGDGRAELFLQGLTTSVFRGSDGSFLWSAT